ncbi:MAG: glucose-6-phosphate isomerase [Rhodobacter sp.]|nr:glucose-6-phosphate isomerase [Rhodobacter sp.]
MVWDALRANHGRNVDRRILELFDDGVRADDFSVRACDMLLDYSKTGIDREARGLLLRLAEAAGLDERRRAMFSGAAINETEARAVLHSALRDPDSRAEVEGTPVAPATGATLRRMEAFAESVRAGHISPPAGQRYTDVINIGIGGSDLGPAMAVQALTPYGGGLDCHFVSNVDGAHVNDVTSRLDPATTLAIVVSKTFTTAETMANAGSVRDWLAAGVGFENAAKQFVAVSSDRARTASFGVTEAMVFGFEDWVGGRFSVWGPVGLSVMLAVGADRFREFLAGGAAMDAHFRTAAGPDNMPLMLALVGIWHNQICGYATRAVLPYEQRLARLPAYLQQLEMESNGKCARIDGAELTEHSCPVVWGEPGTNGQHAFFQLIHQGSRVVPCEFMVARDGHERQFAHHHRMLLANCLAQSAALLRGRSLEEAKARLAGAYEGEELERWARHRVFPGNRPSITLIYPKLTPRVLGQIIALYEHRVFVEGTILGINSFDQWGVELGKELASRLEPILAGKGSVEGEDGSTQALVRHLLVSREIDGTETGPHASRAGDGET